MPTQRKQKVTPLLFETYIVVIKNSIGSRAYRTFIANVSGEKRDITKKGELSCAYFVSSLLYQFQLIKGPHTTVSGTIADMKKSGWKKISRPKIGAVILWDDIRFPDGSLHKHIGFFIGGTSAISNDSKKGVPARHHITYGVQGGRPKRKILGIFWHKKLR